MNSNSSNLQPDEIIQLMKNYAEDNCNDSATALLIHYESIAKMTAAKMSYNRPDLYEDLYQVAQMSLLRLFKQYNSSIGIQFEAYAVKSVIGNLKNYLRDKSWYIQVPRRIKEKGLLIQRAVDELTVALERSPKIEEIANHLGLTPEETMEVLSGRECYNYISLDTPLSSEEDSSSIGDLIGSQRDDYQALENLLDLQEVLVHLKQEEKTVLFLTYNEGQSQRNIAQQLGISQMSVSRIQKRALEKLKNYLSEDGMAMDG
ncbi:MAG TPA: sigma-70 family RNA polymerase sigma factor [Bacilli bacterium]